MLAAKKKEMFRPDPSTSLGGGGGGGGCGFGVAVVVVAVVGGGSWWFTKFPNVDSVVGCEEI